MLLVMHNLPSHMTYSDIKKFINNKCYVEDIILDKLIKDGPTTKQVTIGVAKEEDAVNIVHTLNGTYVEGQQIFVEDVRKSKSQTTLDTNSTIHYSNKNPLINQNPMTGFINPLSAQTAHPSSAQTAHPSSGQTATGYGYAMTNQNTTYGYQNYQVMDQQMVQNYAGYNAMGMYGMAVPIQSTIVAYGNQQGQQAQQLNATQGQPKTANVSGYGYTKSSNEKACEPDKKQGSHQYSGGNNKEFGYRESNYEVPKQGRGYDFDPRFNSDSRGFTYQESRAPREVSALPQKRDAGRKRSYSPERGDRYSNKNRFQSDRFEGNRGFDERGSRDERFGGNQSIANARDKGFAGNQSRGFDNRDSRDNRFGGNQIKNSRWDSAENQNRGGPSRDTYSVKPTPSPYRLINPSDSHSRSNTWNTKFDKPQSKPFGGKLNEKNFDISRPNDRNDTKPGIKWNRNPPPHFLQNSPTKPAVPEKRFKTDEHISGSEAKLDQKTINRAISWRGQAVSFIVKNIMNRLWVFKDANQPGKKHYQECQRMLKVALNSRLDEIIQRTFPNNSYPLLQEEEVVKLYRSTHPQNQDKKLFNVIFQKSKPEVKPEDQKPIKVPTDTKVSQPQPLLSGPVAKSAPTEKFYNFAKTPSAPPSQVPPSQFKQVPPVLKQKPGKKPRPVDLVKQARREQKQLDKKEFLEEDLYKCPTPQLEKALKDELDEITEVFNSAIDDFPNETPEDNVIGQAIVNRASGEFRSVIRLHTIKRIINQTSTLVVRVFINGGKAPKTDVEQALLPYGITSLKASNRSKTQMLVASVDSHENFDNLCTHPGIPIQGRDGLCLVTCKPLHLTIPFKFRRLLRRKQRAEVSDDEEGSEIGEEVPVDGEYDDVIEVIKEPDVIEISGDESTFNIPNDTENSEEVEVPNPSTSKDNVDNENSPAAKIDSSANIIDSAANINASIASAKNSAGNTINSASNINTSVGNTIGSASNINTSVGNTKDSAGNINTSVGSIKDSAGNFNTSVGNTIDSASNINSNVANKKDKASNEMIDLTAEDFGDELDDSVVEIDEEGIMEDDLEDY
ncbi:uncharacterized protein LOC106142167 [Amyelois transitella]|uniref:uncharacterized protein LOC106142167 n=1 Tax=Amyelois transitella TaxID=680683 RepID=UPI002990696E|nr:uncharacterized protein LOC106142167 [Amyelois transitella]